MFRDKPDNRLAAGVVADHATAQAHASSLPPTVGPSAAPATVTAQIYGQGLFIKILIAEDLPEHDRELLAAMARAEVVRLLLYGTGDGGWTWNAAAREWCTAVGHMGDLSILVPDHVPTEWTRAA